jgi:hypothetical protein
VLTFKRQAELELVGSGLPYTLLRPSRLTDGPYTSFDINTLLQATAGTRQDVTLSPRDDLAGEASRLAVAGGWWRAGRECTGGHCSACALKLHPRRHVGVAAGQLQRAASSVLPSPGVLKVARPAVVPG